MAPHYNINWLTDKFDNGEQLKFLFFWGHANKHNEDVGKFCLSQWFELPFVVDGVSYKTAEHWMMANKALLFDDLKSQKKIIDANTPGEAKELGRYVLGFDEQTWRDNRFEIVKQGGIHKFNQHPKFAAYLLNTTNRILAEASPIDTIWGIGLSQDDDAVNNPHEWRGLNLLGFALMEARKFLQDFGHFDYKESTIDLPWKRYPNEHPTSLRWRMGDGEEIISVFAKHYATLSEREKTILRLTNPEPWLWKGFYDE